MLLLPGNVQERIRLAGIDCPERKQAFGTRATQALARLAAGKEVTVEWENRDRYGRIVGKVVYGGKDVDLALVREGMCWWYRHYAHEQSPADRVLYKDAERKARGKGLGLWRDPNPVPPWEWRRERRWGCCDRVVRRYEIKINRYLILAEANTMLLARWRTTTQRRPRLLHPKQHRRNRMKKLVTAVAIAALLGVSASASAWWGGGPWGGGPGYGNGGNDWWNDMMGDGYGDFNMNMSGGGHGSGRGYNRYRDYYGYGYGPYGWGGGYPGYGGYGGGYPGGWGGGYPYAAPVAPVVPVVPAPAATK